jgi:hypothetical protein
MAEQHHYNPDDVEACRSVLIEALTVLGKHRDCIAVVGGWVPELVMPGQGHMGSLDVDLALDADRFPPHIYETVRNDRLCDTVQCRRRAEKIISRNY